MLWMSVESFYLAGNGDQSDGIYKSCFWTK